MHSRPVLPESFQRFQFDHNGTEYLASTTAFRVGDDQVWVIGAVAPKADFLADVWRSQAIALVAAAGALLVAVALAALMARSVSTPVLKLIEFMNRVGGGDLDAKAAFGGSLEFRRLAEALNRMIADLRDRLRLRHSLGVAMEVQQRLLPGRPPARSRASTWPGTAPTATRPAAIITISLCSTGPRRTPSWSRLAT